MIPFNKPYLTGKETHYIYQAVSSGYISGNGYYTKKCQRFFEERYQFKKCLLTTSCTDALEMSAILLDIKPGDEVIMPSYTFVSTAIAFIRQGARIVFADSNNDHPNIKEDSIELLITDKTKAIVVVHYAGFACDMDKIMAIAKKHHLYVVEDAAQAIDSYYHSQKSGKKMALGSIGHLGCFSFHETKNIQAGEGGMIAINDESFIKRSEIIWEKGTNRAEFFRGEVNKYGWVDIGSSFLPSDIIAAFLYAQLENLEDIQQKRLAIWNRYYDLLKPLANKGHFALPFIPQYATNNAHLFYILFHSQEERNSIIKKFKQNKISAVFHYLSLHNSKYYKDKHDSRELKNTKKYTDCLLRLPLYYELTEYHVKKIVKVIKDFYDKK